MTEQAAQLRPEPYFADGRLLSGLEQLAAFLLNLVNQESQHHQTRKHGCQMLVTVTKVVLKVIALVFQGIEGFILNLPAGASATH